MITIVTGVPGMGKTAMIVEMMLKEIEKGDRPFFVMGIPELKLDHSPVPPVIEWTEERPDKDDPTVMLHYFTFPKNSIIIIDEAQRVMRPRASGSKVPPYIAAQETHRHTGVDFWLLTQKPSLLDQNIRELCGRHIHIKDTILGRKLFEWTEYMDVKTKANLDMAVKRSYSPPKKVFSLYKSAEAHTTQPRRMHQIWYVLLIALAVFGYFAYKLYGGLYQKIKNKPTNELSRQLEAESKDINLQNALYTPKKPEQAVNINQQAPQIVHPYIGFDFYIKGSIASKRLNRTYYEIKNETKTIFTNDDELKKLGYSITAINDCSAFLFFNGAQVVASCPKNESEGDSRQRGGGALVLTPQQKTEIDVPPSKLIDNTNLIPSPA